MRSSRSRRDAKEPRLRLRVLTRHVHGNYLYYLSHTPHDFFLPVGRSGPGYAGCAPGFPWPANVHEVPIDALPHRELDCILFQARQHYLVDQFVLLTEEQRQLPRLYLEHDPPLEHPSETCHPVDDPDMLLIHVTHLNRLMWNSRRTPTCVIEHGVVVPDHLSYRGELRKGLVIVNHLRQRGRRLGADLFDVVRARVRSIWSAWTRCAPAGWEKSGTTSYRNGCAAIASCFIRSATRVWASPSAKAWRSASRRSPSPRPRRLWSFKTACPAISTRTSTR